MILIEGIEGGFVAIFYFSREISLIIAVMPAKRQREEKKESDE